MRPSGRTSPNATPGTPRPGTPCSPDAESSRNAYRRTARRRQLDAGDGSGLALGAGDPEPAGDADGATEALGAAASLGATLGAADAGGHPAAAGSGGATYSPFESIRTDSVA
jgi:hypothetical protein